MTEASRSDLNDLENFLRGTYEEVDKLARKTPQGEISDFALERVNRALRDARSMLAKRDRYAADLKEFVGAGQNPEARDAVLALREALQAVERVRNKLPYDPLEGF
jgi:hypothetical protein